MLARPVETIFVDSASSDDSLQVAGALFDRVVSLKADRRLNAACGRAVGASVAAGDWILHLDGDMALEPEFIPEIIDRLERQEPQPAALAGVYRDVYPDGRERCFSVARADPFLGVPGFGGAVLIRRDALLEAGNWDPGITSNEELELLIRLVRRGNTVAASSTPMVRHHTECVSRWRLILGLFVPLPGRFRRFCGFGQLLHANVAAGHAGELLRRLPLVFVWWLCVGVAAAAVLLRNLPVALISLAVGTGLVVVFKGAQYLFVYAGFFPQAILGFWTYTPGFMPASNVGADASTSSPTVV